MAYIASAVGFFLAALFLYLEFSPPSAAKHKVKIVIVVFTVLSFFIQLMVTYEQQSETQKILDTIAREATRLESGDFTMSYQIAATAESEEEIDSIAANLPVNLFFFGNIHEPHMAGGGNSFSGNLQLVRKEMKRDEDVHYLVATYYSSQFLFYFNSIKYYDEVYGKDADVLIGTLADDSFVTDNPDIMNELILYVKDRGFACEPMFWREDGLETTVRIRDFGEDEE